MNEPNECLRFQERFPDLIVEPETAPADLLAAWEQHRLRCAGCAQSFERAQHEQRHGHNLVRQLWHQTEMPALPSNMLSARKRMWPGLAAAAVILMLAFPAGIKFYGQIHRSRDEKQIAGELMSRHRNVMGRLSREASSSFVSQLRDHLHLVRDQFAMIRGYSKLSQGDSRLRHIPLIRVQLMLQCRLFLTDRERCERLVAMPDGSYPMAEIKAIFAASIDGIISSRPEDHEPVAEFFRRAAPHLVEVIRSRNHLLEKMNGSQLQDLGGKEPTLTVIRDMENSLEF